jgi:aryl-alcohol dehydrogenase-like predicted oxidoreductase
MTFGLQCDEAAAGAILERAATAGITFLDTLDVYPQGGGDDTSIAGATTFAEPAQQMKGPRT